MSYVLVLLALLGVLVWSTPLQRQNAADVLLHLQAKVAPYSLGQADTALRTSLGSLKSNVVAKGESLLRQELIKAVNSLIH
jgi:hypothetical protein